MLKIDPNVIAEAGKVTPAFARMLLTGKRKPSLQVALRIYDVTGVQFGPLSGLSAPEIATARKMDRAA